MKKKGRVSQPHVYNILSHKIDMTCMEPNIVKLIKEAEQIIVKQESNM